MLKRLSRLFKGSKNIVCETWNFQQMQNYVDNLDYKIYSSSGNVRRFENFHFFGPDIIKICNGESANFIYSLNGLSRLEIQKDFNSNPLYYSRFVVALVKGEVIGLIVCPFVKEKSDGLPFWRYYFSWVDVKEGFRGFGVVEKLCSELSSSGFLDGHIFQMSKFTRTGIKYLPSKNLDKLIFNGNFCYIPHNYRFKKAPVEFGLFDEVGNRLK
jgi:hypothetical protein